MKNLVAIMIFLSLSYVSNPAFGARPLTRPAAANLIAATSQMRSLQDRIPTYNGYQKDGLNQGLWSTDDGGPPIISAHAGQQIAGLGNFHLMAFRPVPVSVKVTGLTLPSTNVRVSTADFNWNYSNIPKYIKRFALCGGTGQATFVEYDDGWRVTHLSYRVIESRCHLSSGEMAEIQADVGKQTAKTDAILETVKRSKEILPAIKSYTADYYGVQHKYEITPNGVTYYSENIVNGRYNKKLSLQAFYWFGSMYNIQKNMYGIEFYAYPNKEGNKRFINTNLYKMDTDDFLENLKKYEETWFALYGQIPIKYRN